MARVDDIESALERFAIDNFDGREIALAKLLSDRNLRQETEAELAFHHALGCLDGLDFENHIGQQARATE